MSKHSAPAELAELAGVEKTYGSGETQVHALREVDLTLRSGQLVVVLGPSGSGKTSLLNVLGGIEPPSAGRVVIHGTVITGLSAEAVADVRRDNVGFVFQFFNLVPTLTALENVALIAELTGGDATRRAADALASVGLADRGDAFPGQMSGGQQQRVAIARALVTHPRLLLCDEPTGSLDLDTGRVVLGHLQDAARDGDRAVVIVTHNQALAAMADRVVRMHSGRISEDTRQDAPCLAAEVTW